MDEERLPPITEIPFDKFIEEFVKGGEALTDEEYAGIGDFSDLCQTILGEDKRELDVYLQVSEVLDKTISLKSSAQFIYKDTADWDETARHCSKPDGAIYYTTPQAKDAWQLSTTDIENVAEHRKPYSARTAYAFMETYIEVKPTQKSAFYDRTQPDGSFIRRQKAVFRPADYASEIFLRQHREFLFSVHITDTHVRLIRWDRAGAVVSSGIDLHIMARQFLDFISRLRVVTMTPAERGHDPTVQLATSEQIEELKHFCHATKYGRHATPQSMVDRWCKPSYRTVDYSPFAKTFLIGISLADAGTLTGRATRGYAAYDIEKQRLVFMKDSWRSDVIGVHPELEVYRRLREKDVKYVATAIGGGDVGGSQPQMTLNQQWIVKPSVPNTRIHYRLLTLQVGRPLDTYERSADLIVAVKNAFYGHRDAWVKAGILHRDVSVNNILIDIDPTDRAHDSDDGRDSVGDVRGFLNDWDHCKYASELASGPVQQSRSGTWAFLSALLLKYPKKPNRLSDDLESFVYVLAYQTLRYHRHDLSPQACLTETPDLKTVLDENLSNDDLANLKYQLFDFESKVNGHHTGGQHKLACIQSGAPGFNLVNYAQDTPPLLANLLASLYTLLKKHYASVDWAALKVYAARTPTTFVAVSSHPRHPNRRLLVSDSHKARATEERNNDPPTNPPTTRTPTFGPLDTHDHMAAIFDRISDERDEVGYDWDDKTPDQFWGLGESGIRLRKGRSGSKRSSAHRSSVSTSASTSTDDITADYQLADDPQSFAPEGFTGYKRKTTMPVSSDEESEPSPKMPRLRAIPEHGPHAEITDSECANGALSCIES
ncbi:hypothetical protein EIP86_001345 [Pleurotus ostreatoroseus]|nr:hypothetical protein EIP86_001345 [Pleurotus ostreatoroseus]